MNESEASALQRANRTFSAWCAALLLSFAAPGGAQDISPQPATPDDEIRLHFVFPAPGCFNEITDTQVSISDTRVSVYFVVDEVESPVCPTPPPLVLDIALGNFAPGTYELILSGLIRGEPFGPISSEFEVSPGHSATAVPAVGTTGLWLLLLIIGTIGMSVVSRKP